MITRREYKIYHEEGPTRIAYRYTDTYLLGVRISRRVVEEGRRGVSVSPDMRGLVARLDAGECVYCGWSNDQAKTDKQRRKFSIDHVVPQVQGGETALFNLVWCCGFCNSSKGGRTPAEAGMVLRYGRYAPQEMPLPVNRPLFESRQPHESWPGYVRSFGYGPLFDDAFIACDGLIPFMRHRVQDGGLQRSSSAPRPRYAER